MHEDLIEFDPLCKNEGIEYMSQVPGISVTAPIRRSTPWAFIRKYFPFIPTIDMSILFSFPSKNQINARALLRKPPVYVLKYMYFKAFMREKLYLVICIIYLVRDMMLLRCIFCILLYCAIYILWYICSMPSYCVIYIVWYIYCMPSCHMHIMVYL